MDEQFMWDFRTGCSNSAKFARFYDMGFMDIYFQKKIKNGVSKKSLINLVNLA